MERLLIFILCTSSISWIVVSSKLFKPLREQVSLKRIRSEKRYAIAITRGFWWYLDGLLSCVGCVGVYSGLISYLILYRTLTIELIAYSFSGAIISLMITKLIKK